MLDSPHYPTKSTEKCADCFVNGKDTLQIIHTFRLGVLPTCLGYGRLEGSYSGPVCKTRNASTAETQTAILNHEGEILPPRGHLAMSRHFLTATTGQVLLASSGERPGLPLNIPQRTGQRITKHKMSAVPVLTNPGIRWIKYKYGGLPTQEGSTQCPSDL